MENLTTFAPGILVIAIAWSLFWKGMALWTAVKNNQRNWFIALLVVNTLGVLEALYLLLWQKKEK
ncbi:MAG: DUF5652 family protein [bacterium]|nr:DUF5652 family protein [bacterium]